jgi:hypothetical protein
MTNLQIEEFQKLEMAYLESVKVEDAEKQIKMMELIFFWLRKQMRFACDGVILLANVDHTAPARNVSEMQKQEFTFLQMAMIKAAGKDDRERMVQVELKMREWIDLQIADALNKIIMPTIKIVDNYKN